MAEVKVPRGDGKAPNRYQVNTVPEVTAVLTRVRAMRLLAVSRPTPASAEVVAHCDAAMDQLLDLYSEFAKESA